MRGLSQGSDTDVLIACMSETASAEDASLGHLPAMLCCAMLQLISGLALVQCASEGVLF